MTLAEGAAAGVLALEADVIAFIEQRAEGQRLGSCPIDAFAGLEHLRLLLEKALHRLVRAEGRGNGCQRCAHALQPVHRDGGVSTTLVAFGRAHAGPGAIEPVGPVWLERRSAFEGLVEALLESLPHGVVFFGRHGPFLDEAAAVERQRRRMCLDLSVHQRLGKCRLVSFVVAEAAIAKDVDDDVLVKALAEFGSHTCAIDDGLRVIAVHVEDRRLNHQGDVRGIGRGTRMDRRGREANLVVDDQVDGAAGAEALGSRHGETLGHNALACEGGVAMEQDGDHAGPIDLVLVLMLLCANLAENHGVDGLEMRGVGCEREVDLVAVELTVG